MAIKIASWNIEGRLTRYKGGKKRGTPEQIVEEIAKLNADIVVLPEAYLNEPLKESGERLKNMGYEWYDVQYHDTLHEKDVAKWGYPFMRVLYRIPIMSAETRRWGNMRDLPVVIVEDPETKKKLCIIATHLDDLTEERRLQQLDEIIPFIQKSDMPVIMLGDLNAMWHKGWPRLLTTSFMRFIINHLMFGELRNVLSRLSRMATGTVMRRLQKAGLTEADPRLRATTTPKMRSMPFMPSVRFVQIDHVLVSKGVTCTIPTIGRDGGSDHRSVKVKITIP
ncbi:MAG TPA: endonuclease/exonuclease/phosphatase family protein [Candidatus Chromulinivoraceae bacterium]|nr:endonuclease/exonuclease/phosphatase family protein [Candidatus Chromulinivoraceae bacterium]